jgi:hypothetical protein
MRDNPMLYLNIKSSKENEHETQSNVILKHKIK